MFSASPVAGAQACDLGYHSGTFEPGFGTRTREAKGEEVPRIKREAE